MAKISTYPTISPPLGTDLLIGTDVASANATKNFLISDIIGLVPTYALTIKDEGVNVSTNCTSIDIVGNKITATAVGAAATITALGPTITDEGGAVTTDCVSINWTGPNTRATAVGNAVTVTNEGYTDLRLTTAINKIQILSIGSGGPAIEIVPAPGPNLAIAVTGIFIEVFGTVIYGGTTTGLDYFTGGSVPILQTLQLFNSTVPKMFYNTTHLQPGAASTSILENTAVTIVAGSGGTITDPGGADVNLKITALYQVIDV